MKRYWKILAIFIFAGLTVTIFLNLSKNNKPSLPSPATSYEYFWGNGCPHCAKVEEFLNSWDKKDKIQIDKKEVWYDKSNASLMAQRANHCNIPSDQLGVPLLFTPDGKCLIGDQPIIEYFKSLNL